MRKIACVFLLAAGLLAAATPTMPQKKLDAMVKHWQHVLMLDDWEIAASTSRIDDLPEETAGESLVEPQYQVMQIYVLDPADYKALAVRNGHNEKHGKAITRDIENTVVHEMVHLRLRSYRLAKEDDMVVAEELVVSRITAALLKKK
jgi:hypothetical protein